MDLPFLMLVLLLTGIGVIMVFSASYATAYLQEDKSPTFYFFRQALFAAAGLTVMYITSKINYQTFRWLSVFALGLAVLLLIAVLIPGIHTSRSDGVKRWIAVPGIGTFQPSEIAKVAVIMYFSARLSKRNTEKPRRLSPRSPLSGVVGFLDRIGFLELVPYGLILLLIVGCFMDTTAALIILVPILYPVVTAVGVNPIHFAMIICVNLAVGQITPPFGCNLFVACGTAKIGLEAISKKIVPFIVALIACVLLVTYIEPISLILPKMLGAAV